MNAFYASRRILVCQLEFCIPTAQRETTAPGVAPSRDPGRGVSSPWSITYADKLCCRCWLLLVDSISFLLQNNHRSTLYLFYTFSATKTWRILIINGPVLTTFPNNWILFNNLTKQYSIEKAICLCTKAFVFDKHCDLLWSLRRLYRAS